MNASLVRLLIALICVLSPRMVSAQSVESVLCALQERNVVLEWRSSYYDSNKTTVEPIVWPNGIEPFPAEGSITSLTDAIAALNHASSVFEGMKWQFVAYDSNKRRFANLRQSATNEAVLNFKQKGGAQPWITGSDIGTTGFFFAQPDLPSVGQFDEQNWRSKLQLLASNINQLKALTWPVTWQSATAQFGDYPDWVDSQTEPRPTPPTVFPINFDGSDGGKALEWTVNFPNFEAPAGVTYAREKAALKNRITALDGTLQNTTIWPFSLKHSGYANFHYLDDVNSNLSFVSYLSDPAFSWQVFARAELYDGEYDNDSHSELIAHDYLDCITGIRPIAGPARVLTPIPDTPSLNGEWAFFKGPSVAGFGDLTEAVCKALEEQQDTGGSDADPMEGKLVLGLMTPLADAPSNALQLGIFSNQPSPTGAPTLFADRATVVQQTFAWLGIPELSITGTLAGLPQEIEASGSSWSFYGLKFDKGAKARRGFYTHDFKILFKAVFLPQFTPLETGPERLEPFAPPGTVEASLTYYEMARIHLGRGLSDPHQTAWLGMRLDGFGSMTFHGSPEQFELIYEEDYKEFTDQPIGGVKFDAPLEFDAAQKSQSGWQSRFAYLSAWYSPRLKQVKGGDVLVTIDYPTCYKKKLSFSWAKEAGGFDGQFYTTPGPAFKVIEVMNPTAPEDEPGLPVEQHHLRIREGKAQGSGAPSRYHELRYEYIPATEKAPKYEEIFHFKIGSAPDGADMETTVTLTRNIEDAWPPPWKFENTVDGNTESWEVGWANHNYYSPASFSLARPEYIKQLTTGQTGRKVEYEWQDDTVKKVTYTGPTDWLKNGDIIEYRPDGLVDKITSKLGGKPHEVSNEWSGNKRTSTYKLGGVQYRTESAGYSEKFNKVVLSVGGDTSETTVKYNPSGQLASVEYPGGYKEEYSSVKLEDGWSKTTRSGWGNTFASGSTSTTQLSGLGAIMSRTVQTSEGVLLVNDTGSDFTGWGAPTKIQHIQGDETDISYEESGINWGMPLTATDATGVATGVTGYDWRSRATGITTGFEEFIANYDDPLMPMFSVEGGPWVQNTYSSSGELLARAGSDGIPGSAYRVGRDGNSYVMVEGRTVPLGVDAAGVLKSIANGGGSRGAEFDFGVENGMLYTETTPYTKAGGKSSAKIRTYYDGKGRVKSVKRPSENGEATEMWMYDDANQSVTYLPGVEPVAQSITTSLSSNGSELTVIKGGVDYLRYTRTTQNGALVRITERFNDSSGDGSRWDEIARETFDPASGLSNFTPGGIPSNTITTSQTTPAPQGTVTLSGGNNGDDLAITLEGGVPKTIVGTADGLPVNLTLGWTKDVLTSVAGKIAGEDVGMTMKPDGKLLSLSGPGTGKTFSYGNQQGFSVSMNDGVQGTSASLNTDDVGDLTGVSGTGTIPLTLNTVDTLSGSSTTLSVPGATASVQMDFNHLGSLTGKTYSGGILESYALNSDGSLSGFTMGQQQGGYISPTVDEKPTSRTTTYSDATVVEQYYHSGPRSSVSGPNDARNFTYENFQLRTETHTSGPWAGWTVERIPDVKGRLGTLRIKKGSLSRDVSFLYDAYSRLSDSISYKLIGTYTHHPTTGQVATLTRNSLQTTWGRDVQGRLGSLTNYWSVNPTFNYSYPERDSRHRITKRDARIGRQWTKLTYDDASDGVDTGQLKQVDFDNGRSLAYGHDARGNRSNQGAAASHSINGLDQVFGRALSQRGFGILGAVNPNASVLAFNPFVPPEGLPLEVKPSGEFDHYWNVEPTWSSSSASLVSTRILGTLTGAGANGGNAVAEEELYFLIPPVNEDIVADHLGRTKEDAFWRYSWTDSGNLRQMIRREGTFRRPNVESEVVDFVYDADGRRTQKTHTVTLAGGTFHVDKSKVLWSGCLPVMEERRRDGQLIDRRLFQWGADLSGTLDGAGGIGGLVAIIEEKASGQVRTLLPIQDGLGNVTAVIDQSTGATVARYDYGPFGEPLGETGEADACPFRFQTKWYDAESEHYYFGYRYYSPRLGTWLSRDPLGETGGVNLYAYCGGDPVNRHDPTGLAEVIYMNPADAMLLKIAKPLIYRGLLGSTDGTVFLMSEPTFGTVGNDLAVARLQARALAQTTNAARNIGAGGVKIAGGIAGMAVSGFAELGFDGVASPVALPAFAGSASLFASGVRQWVNGDSVTFGEQLVKMGADLSGAEQVDLMLDISMLIAPGSQSSRFLERGGERIHVGTGREYGRIGAFNPKNGIENCAACVSAFIRTMKERELITAVEIERRMGSKLGRGGTMLPPSQSLSYIQNASGVRLATKRVEFGGAFADTLAAGDYVLLAQEHVMIGRVLKGGERLIFDVQNQAFIKDWASVVKRYGPIDAYRVLYP